MSIMKTSNLAGSRMICVFLVALVLLSSSNSPGKPRKPKYEITWVRGRILRQGKLSYPASKVRVTLVPNAYKDDASRAVLTYTGEDGMYDFKVPAGKYILTVWGSEKESKKYLIDVRQQKYFDVAPLVIP